MLSSGCHIGKGSQRKIKSTKFFFSVPLDVGCKFWNYRAIEATVKNKTNFNLGKILTPLNYKWKQERKEIVKNKTAKKTVNNP